MIDWDKIWAEFDVIVSSNEEYFSWKEQEPIFMGILCEAGHEFDLITRRKMEDAFDKWFRESCYNKSSEDSWRSQQDWLEQAIEAESVESRPNEWLDRYEVI